LMHAVDVERGSAEVVISRAALALAGVKDTDPLHAQLKIYRLALSYPKPDEQSPTFLPELLFTQTFPNLTELWLQNVIHLTTLPASIGACKQLQVLHAQGCALSSLPARLVECTQLRVLRLSRNRLTTVPLWIGYLSKLEALWLDSNKLTFLPPELGALQSLKQLKLAGNASLRLPPGCMEYTSSHMSKDQQLRAMQAEVVVHHLFALLYWTPAQHRMFHGQAGATTPLKAVLLAASRAATLELVPLLPPELWWEIFKFINGLDFNNASTAKAMEDTVFKDASSST